MRGQFKIFKTDSNTLQIDDSSSILISRERFQPNGSDFLLGDAGPDDNGTEQELRISSRIYMTRRQIEAEENSINYMEEMEESPPQEILVQSISSLQDDTFVRTAPYEPFCIKGLGFNFKPEWNDDVRLRDHIYLELDLWRSLDIRSAQIVVGPVGQRGGGSIPGEDQERIDFIQGENEILGWPSYPSSYLFSLEMNSNGDLVDSITREPPSFGEERFQKKAYVLLAYLTKDYVVRKNSIVITDDNEERFGVVSCINSDLLVQHGIYNETPVLNLAPHFGAGHLNSNYFASIVSDE